MGCSFCKLPDEQGSGVPEHIQWTLAVQRAIDRWDGTAPQTTAILEHYGSRHFNPNALDVSPLFCVAIAAKRQGRQKHANVLLELFAVLFFSTSSVPVPDDLIPLVRDSELLKYHKFAWLTRRVEEVHVKAQRMWLIALANARVQPPTPAVSKPTASAALRTFRTSPLYDKNVIWMVFSYLR